jgi:signal transduction histidine kinase
MVPERIRMGGGFRRCASTLLATPMALAAAGPVVAQSAAPAALGGVAPLVIALGVAVFGIVVALVLRGFARNGQSVNALASGRIAELRAQVDRYEGLLSGAREVTIVWSGPAEPRILGQSSALLRPGQRPEAILSFSTWLPITGAAELATALDRLTADGIAFELQLNARDGKKVRASGWPLDSGSVLRLTPVAAPGEMSEAPAETGFAGLRSTITALSQPAFLRDADGRVVFANEAYLELADSLGIAGTGDSPPDLVGALPLSAGRSQPVDLGRAGPFKLVQFPVPGGTAGYLEPLPAVTEADAPEPLGGVIDALANPIAIFDAKRELVHANGAYANLWRLDPAWLQPGLEERAILDKLRTEGQLPVEGDYKDWRAKHLTASYGPAAAGRTETWHLPDGRTINMVVSPRREGGVIYAFENITDQLKLISDNRALAEVQRSTLNSLTEAVAVFGTNGRLALYNPRFSALWKVPTNALSEKPHIDEVARISADAMPDDGTPIWRDLKRSIIDLNPTREDRQGRIERADGKLIDYAVVRLPDGQTMMTFLDVTESANYQRVLKERNDALVTADRLKDAFVQNVSYELRSPLTNIIGFADLLASPDMGPLNDRQRAYTDYIRASSVTLGVLIDNILDLATVDAGVAELRPELLDVHALVEKARAGLAATFPQVDGEAPLNLVVHIPEVLPPFVADGTRLVQVLYNLLSNAARFSEPGAEIRLSVSARGERVIFTVEDEGVPMEEDMRPLTVGNREAASGGRQRGAEFGLNIVRTFVNLHGGTITVEKREPRGSRVIVNLPRDASMAGAAE